MPFFVHFYCFFVGKVRLFSCYIIMVVKRVQIRMFCFVKCYLGAPRDGQYRDTSIGDTYRAILLYRYRYRLSVSLQYRVSVSIKHVFVHRRYKYLNTVFEHDQSYHVLTACSFTVYEECEMKLNSLIDSKTYCPQISLITSLFATVS